MKGMMEHAFTVRALPKSYDVFFDGGDPRELLAGLDDWAFFIDANVAKLYMNASFEFQANEENKSVQIALRLIEKMLMTGITKKNPLIVIGGGITQDVCAFACAMVRRGHPWVFAPTTLLSMVDSCIGGKCALNYAGTKNQLALWSNPTKVIINLKFLETLSPLDIASGMGEALKLHRIAGKEMPKDMKNLILSSLLIKRAIIEKDQFELNERKVLNYGHTFGHAIETLSEYRIPHGIAVQIGMRIADLYFDLPLCPWPGHFTETLRELDFSRLPDLLRRDKKTEGPYVTLVNAIDGKLVEKKLEINDDIAERVQKIVMEG